MPQFKSLGARMKFYEEHFGTNLKYAMPYAPTVVRLDGKAFHTFTKGLERPFDQGLTDLMDATTTHLVQLTNACIGYTQSDEISLVLYSGNHESQIYFDGKIDKINSVLASECSTFFNDNLQKYVPTKADKTPIFDCRTFCVPTQTEAVNAILWREKDATRNSIQMLGQSNFSHKELQRLSCDEIQEKLWQEKDINWNDLDVRLKRGGYFQRKTVQRPFTDKELEKLPPKHEAHKNPKLTITRTQFIKLNMPVLTKVINAEDVFFRSAMPICDGNK
jgi:tRNA(His) 5'-end guanylyltransferase